MGISAVFFHGGLLVFAVGFLRFTLRHAVLEQRTEDLEELVQGLQERMEGQR